MTRRKAAEISPATMAKTTYALNELPALLEELARPVPVAEIQRRRRLAEKALKLRSEIGPIGIDAAELVREVREESAYGD